MKKSKYSPKDEHDIVLYKLINILDSSKNDIYPNILKERTTKLNSLIPDIILTKKNETQVEIILEVETAETVSVDQIPKWTSFSKEALNFYLIVPKNMKKEAEELCFNNQVTCNVLSYLINEEGGIEEIETY